MTTTSALVTAFPARVTPLSEGPGAGRGQGPDRDPEPTRRAAPQAFRQVGVQGMWQALAEQLPRAAVQASDVIREPVRRAVADR